MASKDFHYPSVSMQKGLHNLHYVASGGVILAFQNKVNRMEEKAIDLLNKLRSQNQDIAKPTPKDPYKVMVNCILSHRTREENALKASNNLFKRIQSPQQLLKLPEDELKKLIRCSGFYNQKARYLKKPPR